MKQLIYLLNSVFIVLLISCGTMSAQGTIKGKVIDDSGEPVLYGSVALYKAGALIKGTQTDFDGNYLLYNINPGTYDLEISYIGLQSQRIEGVIMTDSLTKFINVELASGVVLSEVQVISYSIPRFSKGCVTSGGTITSESIEKMGIRSVSQIAATTAGVSVGEDGKVSIRGSRGTNTTYYIDGQRMRAGGLPPISEFSNVDAPSPDIPNNETYETSIENKFELVSTEALSTFSIDVDRASYSNMRRYLNLGQIPPSDAIRIEEMINYFDYNYDAPKDDVPFKIHHELGVAPWNPEHHILKVALQGRKMDKEKLPPSNFVFLVDVSGSMNSPNKLGLVKSSMELLVNNMNTDDRVAIVVYAGAAGLVLESTPISDKEKIHEAIEMLRSGGSTAGGAGIKLAYKTAKENFMKDGNNRIILATDGDFNVGVNEPGGLEKLVEKERNHGVFLSVLGYGMGNYRGDMMQILADKGNGNHSYIDNLQEARKVLISEFAGTLYTIAKDVKIQIEFNPAHVEAYRLIGYSNRMLEKEDFNNDKIDAGELGMGHTVTALYEIIPVGSNSTYIGKVDRLKYQKNKEAKFNHSAELCTVKLRYKAPDSDKSKKIVELVTPDVTSFKKLEESTRFAMAVTAFGMVLSESPYKEKANLSMALELAQKAKTHDPEGYRAEFCRLVEMTKGIGGDLAKK